MNWSLTAAFKGPLIRVSILSLVLSCCDQDPGSPRREVQLQLLVEGPGEVAGFPASSAAMTGDTLVLRAEPTGGALFTGWRCDRFITDNPLLLRVAEPVTVVAVFARKPEGMTPIAARDSTFHMGSDDPSSDRYERPRHEVRFTYDYYLSACEVTRKEYREAMGEEGPQAADAHDDSLPVSFVSWYDAVLYCNARSAIEGYDTVYSYTARCASDGACPYVFENLTVRYDRFGYRLPTEAEWEYGCRAGSDARFFWGSDTQQAGTYAWYFGNAEGRAHPVGNKAPNVYGLYDIVGNVAEWVNDWLEPYADSPYVDPVGPVHLTQEQFEESYERPLRGGSYRLSSRQLRTSTRKDQYQLFSSPTVDIGFRVALGAFGAPEKTPEVMIPESLSIALSSNKSDILELLGTNRVKLVLSYAAGKRKRCVAIDFDRSPIRILQCGDDSDVVAPAISPDGNYIAYGDRDEGALGTGTITVRSWDDIAFPVRSRVEGYLPRWWVDTLKRDTFLIYTDGASLDDVPQWYSEKTLRQRISAGVAKGDAEVLWGLGSYHGGVSSDGRFLGTAYPRAKVVDLQIGDTNLHYFLPPFNGRNDTPQVCNFSMSPSRREPGEALFLDFGYPAVSTLVGRPYDFHTILFIANTRLLSDDHVSDFFESPQGYEWNYTEWSNYPGAIIAVAQPSGAGEDQVVMIHRDTRRYLTLAAGDGFRHVSAWIDPASVSEINDPWLDFGKYDLPPQTHGQEDLAMKLCLFWHERERVSCIAIGNSPMLYGFDPHAISTLPTLNMAWFQSSIGTSVTVALQYVLPHATGCRAIILDLDASYFDVDSRTARPRLTGLYDSKGYALDSVHSFYRSGLPAPVIEKISSFTDDLWPRFDGSGAFRDSVIGGGWGEPVVEGYDYSVEDSIVKVNLDMLRELVDSAAARGIVVIAVNFPQNPGYRSTEMAGKDGPRQSTFRALVELLREMEERFPNFRLYDAHNGGEHDYTDMEAMDTNHLNGRGGRKLAARVDSLLQTMLE